MIVSLPARHGYAGEQEAAWDEQIRQQLRTPDDGQPLTVMDWLHLNLLARNAFNYARDDDWLWQWRIFAGTALQQVCVRRLVAHGLVTICDNERSYCRLSARGLRKVSALWRHLQETINESQDATTLRLVL